MPRTRLRRRKRISEAGSCTAALKAASEEVEKVAIVIVNPGVCGFQARIEATMNEDLEIALGITSECGRIRRLAEELTTVSALSEVTLPMPATQVYQAAGACKLHAACPLPSAILKAVEVAAGLALPADVVFSVRREA